MAVPIRFSALPAYDTPQDTDLVVIVDMTGGGAGVDKRISYAQLLAGFAPSFADIAGQVDAAQLPAPTVADLGGVLAVTPVTHQWVYAIDTTGAPLLSQPAFADISGSLAAAQLPTGVNYSDAVLAITGGASLTATASGSGTTPILALAHTFDTTGVITAIKLDITNTASGAGSLLVDLQVGGTSKFSIDLTGIVTFASSTTSIKFDGEPGSLGWGNVAGGQGPIVSFSGTSVFGWFASFMATSIPLGFASTVFGGSIDVAIARNAAGILEINDGTLGTFADLKVRNNILSGYLQLGASGVRSSGSGPTITAGAGAGTSSSVSITGNDTAGQITVNCGDSPAEPSQVQSLTLTAAAISGTYTLTYGGSTTSAIAFDASNDDVLNPLQALAPLQGQITAASTAGLMSAGELQITFVVSDDVPLQNVLLLSCDVSSLRALGTIDQPTETPAGIAPNGPTITWDFSPDIGVMLSFDLNLVDGSDSLHDAGWSFTPDGSDSDDQAAFALHAPTGVQITVSESIATVTVIADYDGAPLGSTVHSVSSSGTNQPVVVVDGSPGQAEVQTIAEPAADGGTFGLIAGAGPVAVDWNATVAAVQTAIDTLLGADQATVSGSDGGPWIVTWAAPGPQSLLTTDGSTLTISVTVAVSITDSSDTLATITFAAAKSSTPYIQLTPANVYAAIVAGYPDSGSTSGFTLASLGALSPGQTYFWNYWIAE